MLSNLNSKYVNWAFILLCCFLVVLTLKGLKSLDNQEFYAQRTIQSTGSGEAFAVPDIASFSFGVTEVGDTVKAAQEKADVKINKALSIVREAGIEDKDIKTTNYSVYPKYEWEQAYCIQMVGAICPQGKNVLKGYEVTQTISIKVRDTEKAGDLVTQIGSAKVDNISGIEFTVDDREKYVAEAREEAINEAKENAKVLAKSLGVRLGKVAYFNESGNYMPIPYYGKEVSVGMGGDMMNAAVAPQRAELPSGETKIVSEVTITYEIK